MSGQIGSGGDMSGQVLRAGRYTSGQVWTGLDRSEQVDTGRDMFGQFGTGRYWWRYVGIVISVQDGHVGAGRHMSGLVETIRVEVGTCPDMGQVGTCRDRSEHVGPCQDRSVPVGT
jgi:hypothetical protein